MKHQWHRTMAVVTVIAALSVCLSQQTTAQETKPSYTLIKNVKIFDGVNDRLTPGHVLIENNLIKQVGEFDTVLPKGRR